MDLVNYILDTIEENYIIDVLNYDEDTITLSMLGFDYYMIEFIENECDVLLNFEYKVIDDVECVEIEIRS